ncbi:hypothetical protein DMH17_12635 [Raoultella planticola]|nr:hypothetical protein [Raoultella planticola]
MLLFHGVGDNPAAMGQIGSLFAPQFPDALIVSIGGGTFAVHRRVASGSRFRVTEENRQSRIDAIMPTFIETVRYWQKQSGVGPRATALIGSRRGDYVSGEHQSRAWAGITGYRL